MNTTEQAIAWAERLRPKFEGQCGDVSTDCADPEDLTNCMWDMAGDLAHDAGCPEDLIPSVSKLLWPE